MSQVIGGPSTILRLMNLTCLQGGCSEDEAPLVGHPCCKCTQGSLLMTTSWWIFIETLPSKRSMLWRRRTGEPFRGKRPNDWIPVIFNWIGNAGKEKLYEGHHWDNGWNLNMHGIDPVICGKSSPVFDNWIVTVWWCVLVLREYSLKCLRKAFTMHSAFWEMVQLKNRKRETWWMRGVTRL